MWRPGLLLLFLLAGCSGRDQTPASAYRHPLDRLQVALGLDGVFGYACYRDEGNVRIFVGMTNCYRFGPPRRMRGVWRSEFEGSQFFPGRTTPPREDERSSIWLSVEENESVRAALGHKRGEPWSTRLIFLDFVGRQTLYPGSYGHMGMSQDFVIVDRLISARPLPQR
jgi:hypothetical protein